MAATGSDRQGHGRTPAHAAHVRPWPCTRPELDTRQNSQALARRCGTTLVHFVSDAPVDDEFIRLRQRARTMHCCVRPCFVANGYQYALSNPLAGDGPRRAAPLADPAEFWPPLHDLGSHAEGSDPQNESAKSRWRDSLLRRAPRQTPRIKKSPKCSGMPAFLS